MKKTNKLLVVDDNKAILSALKLLLGGYFEQVITLSSPNSITTTIKLNSVDVVLLDMNYTATINSGNEGLYWLDEIKKIDATLPVVVFTAYADIELAVEAIKRGASDFIVKPWDNSKLISTLLKACETKGKSYKSPSIQFSESVMHWGEDIEMRRLKTTIEKVATTDANILITGENGTGKEVLSREIHTLSERRRQPLVVVDMGAIAESLFESELFGHVKGAFTGAVADREGKFSAANGGTLFLDEIANLPYHLQAKLLTVIQSKSVVKVGSNKPEPTNVRLICATNQNLEKMVAEGTFREDLYYRINTIHTELPPLRNRQCDIVFLATQFLTTYSNKYQKPIESFSKEAQESLTNHYWAGNIRELQHTIEKAVILCDGTSIEPCDLLLRNPTEEYMVGRESKAITLESVERQTIESSIKRNGGNMSTVALELGITRQTLYNKIKKYGL